MKITLRDRDTGEVKTTFSGPWDVEYPVYLQTIEYIDSFRWADRTQYFKDYKDLMEFYEYCLSLLEEVLDCLGDDSNKVVRSVFGPWLALMVFMTFDKYMRLKRLKDGYEILGVQLAVEHSYKWPQSLEQLLSFFHKTPLNDFLNGLVVKSLFGNNVDIDWVPGSETRTAGIDQALSAWRTITSLGKNGALWFKAAFAQKYSALGEIGYFGVKSVWAEELSSRGAVNLEFGLFEKMEFLINQPTMIFRKKKCFNIEMRDISHDWGGRGKDMPGDREFGELFLRIIDEIFPYADLDRIVKQGPIWDAKIKGLRGVLTETGYLGSVKSRFLLGRASALGIRVGIYQHGGNFGMTPFCYLEQHQKEISNFWFNWSNLVEAGSTNIGVGFDKNRLAHVPAFNNRGSLVISLMALPKYPYFPYSVPVSRMQNMKYFEEIRIFISSLSDGSSEHLEILPHSLDDKWEMDAKKILDSAIRKKGKSGSLKGLLYVLDGARLHICTYNATTFLETLALNFPTLIFWNPQYFELNAEASEFFEILARANIFWTDPAEAAVFVNSIVHDVESWWFSSETQLAVEKFTERYVVCGEDTLKNIVKIMKDV